MQHHFDVEVAEEYGVRQAILINHMQAWIKQNRANGEYQREGRTWAVSSRRSLAELFAYFTDMQVRAILKKLEGAGVLMSGNFNKTPYDRTKWYAFVDEGKWLGSDNNIAGEATCHSSPSRGK